MSAQNRIEFDYTSDGRKLSCKQVTGSITNTDMYIDGLIIRNGYPHTWQFDGGYAALNTNGTVASWNYYIKDHLGSTRMVVGSNNTIKETISYYPFGSEITMTPPGQLTPNPDSQPYRFTGKELVKQNGLNMYDFGARWFDVAGVPMWTSMDPLCEKYYNVSPYAYCAGDPVNAIDPDGNSTWVVNSGNGKYRVFNGDINDGDNNIYLYYKDSKGKMKRGRSIGESAFMTSFYDTDKKEWAKGSIIDTKDQSGVKFLKDLMNNTPGLKEYIDNAGNGEKYDFKETNGILGGKKYKTDKEHYRGMPITEDGNKKIFSSARDIGNIGAGFIAGSKGLSWGLARLGFDAYQTKQAGHLSIEGKSSQNAQYLGWHLGRISLFIRIIIFFK